MTLRKPKSKVATAPGTQKRAGEALMSSADLYRATGYGQSGIAEMVATGVIKQERRNEWPVIKTLGAIVRRLRTQQAGQEDRARKNKAEADTAELDALTAAGKTCLITDAKQFWSDARIELRQTIERAGYLTPIQKTKLLTEFANLKMKLEVEK